MVRPVSLAQTTRTARWADVAGVTNRAGNVAALMPHPEHAVEKLIGSTDGRILLHGLLELASGGRRGRVELPVGPAPSPRARRPREGHSTDSEFDRHLRGSRELPGANRTPSSWPSTHCSGASIAAYKHSRLLLRQIFLNPRRARPPGPRENAGVIDVGDGLAVALKVESRTTTPRRSSRSRARPPGSAASSAISSRWARGLLAILDSLRFGELDNGHQRHLFSPRGRGCWLTTATASASPTSAARSTSTPPGTQLNCLVNAMCVGVLPADRLTLGRGGRARATCSSSTVARTGRDGIGGASVLASQGFDERSSAKRPKRPDRRPVHGQEADRVHAGAA